MAKIVDKQTTFNVGILTDKLRGRTDMKQYDSGLSDAFNFFVTKYGPIIKRTGTVFKWDLGNPGAKSYLIPFIFNINECVLLEFLHKKIRFYIFDGEEFGPIADPTDPSKNYELVTDIEDSLLDKIAYAQSMDVLYLAFSDGVHRPKELRRYANNSWRYVDYEFEDGPYLDTNYDQTRKVSFDAVGEEETVGPGDVTMRTIGFTLGNEDIGRHIRVNHIEPDTLEDRWGWGVIQSVDNTAVAGERRYKYYFNNGVTSLSGALYLGLSGTIYVKSELTVGENQQIPAYIDPDCTEYYGYVSSVRSNGLIGIEDVHIRNGHRGFVAGQNLTLQETKIISEEAASTAVVRLYQKVWSTEATPDFRLGAWSDAQGWPNLVTIHEQRLVWQGTTNFPWLWMSNSFNYKNFSPSDYSGNVKDSNAIYYNLATDKLAPVKWLASLGSLMIGTEGYEMRLYSAGAGLAPSDCVARKETTYGCHDALPLLVDDTLIFIQRLQRKLRSISYDYTRDAYVGPELSILSEALTIPGLKKMVHQREPNDIIWCLMEDGTLLALTYDKEQSVQGWTRAEIAGTDARVIDMAVLPSNSHKQDMLILSVERTINGQRKRYMELLSKEYTDDRVLKDISYLDCSIRYQGEEANSISGLDYLEGEEVTITNAGGLHEKERVVNGTVSFKYPITDGWIGLPYRAYFETLERDISDQSVSIKMSKVRIHRLVLYLLRTLGLTVSQQSRGLTTQLITFSPVSNMDISPEPVSGEHEHDIMTAWTSSDMHYTLRFESEPALPCTVAGIYAGVEINAL